MKRIRISCQIDWCFWIFHLPWTQISLAWFMPLFHLYILQAFFVIWPCQELSPAFEWGRETKRVSWEFDGQSTGVFGFSIYRAHKSVLTLGAAIIFVRSKTKWHSIVSWRCFSVINLFLKKIYYRHLLWKESEFHGEWTGAFGFSIYRAHKSVLTIGAAIIFVRSKTKWHSIVSWRCFSAINVFLKKISYRHLLWKESEFHGKSTGVFGFSIYRAQ